MTRPGRLFLALGTLLVALAFGQASGHFWHAARCAVLLPDVDPPPGRAKLLSCTNIEQAVYELSPGLTDAPAESSGWSMITGTGAVTVILRKQADRVVFYPRLYGEDASVTVSEVLGRYRKKLFSLHGKPNTWTPIGTRQAVCLSCVENGWSDEEFPITLEIVLTGNRAQLWHKGEAVFFEAP